MSLELERERPPRVCRLCGDPTDGVCPKCGVDKNTGELVQEPEPPPSGPVRDGTRPLRRRAAELLAIPKSTRQWLGRGARESLQSWPATLLIMAMVGLSLSFQRVPWVNAPLPWPGQIMASFLLAFLTIEHARGAREGQKGLLDARGGAFDPSMLGVSLAISLFLLPLYAGPFMGSPWIAVLAGLPVTLLFPAFLGALATDSAEELGVSRIKQAIVESPHYLRTTLVSMWCLIGGLCAVWLPSDESPVWRAPLAVMGVTLAGTLCGLMRKDAETMIDDDADDLD